jgi:hypothetical protein
MKYIFFIAILFLISCDTTDMHEFDGFTSLKYSPTQCLEKWQFGSTDTETIANIEKYLKENGITIISISISKPDGKIYCAACSCPSGRVISIKADSANAEKLVKLGFVKI